METKTQTTSAVFPMEVFDKDSKMIELIQKLGYDSTVVGPSMLVILAAAMGNSFKYQVFVDDKENSALSNFPSMRLNIYGPPGSGKSALNYILLPQIQPNPLDAAFVRRDPQTTLKGKIPDSKKLLCCEYRELKAAIKGKANRSKFLDSHTDPYIKIISRKQTHICMNTYSVLMHSQPLDLKHLFSDTDPALTTRFLFAAAHPTHIYEKYSQSESFLEQLQLEIDKWNERLLFFYNQEYDGPQYFTVEQGNSHTGNNELAMGADYPYNYKFVYSFFSRKYDEIKERNILKESFLNFLRFKMIDYTFRFALVLEVYSFDKTLLESHFTDESLFVIDKKTLEKALKIADFFMDQYVKAYEISQNC